MGESDGTRAAQRAGGQGAQETVTAAGTACRHAGGVEAGSDQHCRQEKHAPRPKDGVVRGVFEGWFVFGTNCARWIRRVRSQGHGEPREQYNSVAGMARMHAARAWGDDDAADADKCDVMDYDAAPTFMTRSPASGFRPARVHSSAD